MKAGGDSANVSSPEGAIFLAFRNGARLTSSDSTLASDVRVCCLPSQLVGECQLRGECQLSTHGSRRGFILLASSCWLFMVVPGL